MTKWRERIAVAVLFIITILFVSLRVFGYSFFDNNWSLTHWLYQPWWYNILWSILFLAVVILLMRKSRELALFFNSTLKRIAGLLVIVILLVLFQFDSILFAGGNLRVAQFAQTDYIIHRWFEFGSTFLAAGFYEIFQLMGVASNTAAEFGWNTLLWISVLFSLWGSILLTGELTRRSDVRFWLFFIIFLGPQTLALFGLIGPEITIIPVTIWFAFFAFKAQKSRAVSSIISMWLILLLGCFMHYTAAFLIPAAMYLTIRNTLQLKKWSLAATMATLFSQGILLTVLYYFSSANPEFTQTILFPEGKNPFLAYGLLAPGHISDVIQILLLAAPQLLLVLYLFLVERHEGANIYLSTLCWVMLLGGITMIFITDPVNSIVLDLPRLVVYLTPAGILLASYVRSAGTEPDSPGRLPALSAAAALLLPFAYLPVYSFISNADSYAKKYFDENPSYYISGGLAMRDAFFYGKDFDKANEWEQMLPVKSPDYLGFDGAQQLALRGQFDAAAEELYRLKIKYPFWIEPRVLLTEVQLKVGRLVNAKAEIDTLLLLEPYKRKHHRTLIKYCFASRNYDSALTAANLALDIFSDDRELLVDKMTALYSTRQFEKTDSLARDLIRIDSNLASPYMFKGLVLERSGNKELAQRYYEQFLKLSPDSPDAPEIRKRLNAIVVGADAETNPAGN